MMSESKNKSLFAELAEMLWLAFPIIVTMTSHSVMQLVDALMLGHKGRDELAAVSPAGLLAFIPTSFLLGICTCTNTFVSQSIGRGRPGEGARYVWASMRIALAGGLIALPLAFFAQWPVAMLGHGPKLQELERIYFAILILRVGAVGIVSSLASFFQAAGRPGVPMWTGISANVINVIGDYLLIFGHFGLPEWGIFGAALATVAASWLEAAVLLAIFLGRKWHGEFGTRFWRDGNMQRVRQMLRVGVGAGLNFAMDLASWTVFMGIVIGRLGPDILAGNNAASQLMHLSFMPVTGLNIAVTALVGRHIGQGDCAGAKRRAYLAMALACLYMTCMGLGFVLFRSRIIMQFNSQPDVIRAGSIILVYMALFQFAEAIGIVSFGALKGAGDTRFPAIMQLLLAWLFFVPLALAMVRYRPFGLEGIHGAWIAAAVYIWALDAVLFWRFRAEKWRRMDIFR